MSVDRQRILEISYESLLNEEDLGAQIEEAFGVSGLGIIAVKGVPGLEPKRQALLPLAAKFAALPEEVKKKTETPECWYAFGWSHGKEKLAGKPDYSKGSYYNNPQYNKPFADQPEVQKRWPSFAGDNIWPDEALPELEPAFLNLGRLIVDVGKLVAKQCDRYVKQKMPEYEATKLYDTLENTKNHKARLLNYFAQGSQRSQEEALEEGAVRIAAGPVDDEFEDVEPSSPRSASSATDPFSDWCGWHNDHGSLTGLCPAIFTDDATGEQIPNPDPSAGLYIKSRKGITYQVSTSSDNLLFQIGETAQIHSGGCLQATPHAVRGVSTPGVSRQTFAVFMEPQWDGDMNCPPGAEPSAAQSNEAARALPMGVPTLASRWGTEACAFTTCDFGAFTEVTLNAYH